LNLIYIYKCNPGQTMSDVWWTQQHWERYCSEYFSFHPSVAFHQCLSLTLIYVLWPEGQKGAAWERTKR